MIDPLQQLAADPNLDANFRRILAGKPTVSPAIGEFVIEDRLKLISVIEGAIAVLANTADPYATAATSILKAGLRK